MFNKPEASLAANSAAFENTALVKPTGFREYDARWLFPDEINLTGIQALGFGLGNVLFELLGDDKQPEIIVGHDFRSYSQSIKLALSNGLMSAGVAVHDIGLALSPTAYFAQFDADIAAVAMVTASHNENGWTGVKMGAARPLTFGPDEMDKLRRCVLDNTGIARKGGSYQRIDDMAQRYKDDLTNRPAFSRTLKAVVACGNGTVGAFAPDVLEALGVEVVALNCDLDHSFPNHNPNPEDMKMLHALRDKVLETGADIGFAFDGDGDRLVMVNASGELLDGDHLLYVITQNRLAREAMHGGVVGTVMSNLGLEQALKELAVPFLRAQVGDRHIMEALHQRQWVLGGEPSGHILTLDLCSTGDAIVAGLQVLLAMQDADVSLQDLASGLTKAPQVLVNVVVNSPAEISRHPDMLEATASYEHELADRGRILVRPSGTEPLLRIMVEGEDESEVTRIANDLAEHAKSIEAA